MARRALREELAIRVQTRVDNAYSQLRAGVIFPALQAANF